MVLTPAQTANFLDVLGPAMAGSGLPTKVECCATEGWDYAQQYAAAIEADPVANSYTPVFTSHGYTQAPASPLSGWTKPAWQTEWSTFETWDPAWDDGTDASGLTWAQHIYTGLTAANLSAFLYWWGSTTPSENGDNEGLVEINGSTVIPSGRLWAFANYSRYVRPGAVRIAATSSNSAVDLTAFRNPDGSVAVVALNTGTSADPVTYSLSGTGTPSGATVTPYLTSASSDTAAQAATTVSGGAFTATVPARSLVTYVIGSSGSGMPTPAHRTPTGSPTGSPTPTPTPTPTSSGAACTVTYSTPSQWAGGFVAAVTIANSGSAAINGWTLAFTFPGDQKITNAWSGTVTQSGATVSITNAGYNATIAAGSSVSLGSRAPGPAATRPPPPSP